MNTPISEQDKNRIKLQGFLEDKLKWHAYTHIVVADDDMPTAAHFIHTIGRARSDAPELILTGGIDPALAMDLIADVVAHERRAGGLNADEMIRDGVRLPVLLKDVSTEFVRRNRVAQATSRFGADLRVFQIVWPDGQGRYPSDPLYDAAGCPQQALWEAG